MCISKAVMGGGKQEDIFFHLFSPVTVVSLQAWSFLTDRSVVVCGYLQEGVSRITGILDNYFLLLIFLPKMFLMVMTKLDILDILLHLLLVVQSFMGNIAQQCSVVTIIINRCSWCQTNLLGWASRFHSSAQGWNTSSWGQEGCCFHSSLIFLLWSFSSIPFQPFLVVKEQFSSSLCIWC